MSRPQGGARAAHGADALAGNLGGVGFAEHLAINLEHRVAADDEDGIPLGQLWVSLGQGLAHVCALGGGEGRHLVSGGGGAS